LWAWGTGIQVGVADYATVPVPYPVEFPPNRQVISVSCGGQHTVALTVRNEAKKFDAAAVNETIKNGVSRTVSSTPGIAPSSNESVKLNSVPPEAKKCIARHSGSDHQKTDSNVDTEKNCAVSSVSEVKDKATGMDIAMHSLSTSSGEQESDNAEADCNVEWMLESTCIDDASTTSNCANVNGENSDCTVREAADLSCTDSSTQNIPVVKSSDVRSTGCGSVPKSRSSFLDETEAIMFLEKQLSDANSNMATVESRSSKDRNLTGAERKDGQDVAQSQSPFAKTVESLLQRVPSSPVVQEYVSNLTKTVVSNLRTSVDRRLNYVTSQVELSMRNITSLNKVAAAGEAEVHTALDDAVLLERLGLSSCVSSFCTSGRKAIAHKIALTGRYDVRLKTSVLLEK